MWIGIRTFAARSSTEAAFTSLGNATEGVPYSGGRPKSVPLLAAHLGQLAQILQGVLHVGHGHADPPAGAIALGQEHQFVKILGRLQSPPQAGPQLPWL